MQREPGRSCFGAPPPYLYTAVMLALRAGLRLSNVRGIRWRNLRNGNSEIHLPAAEMKSDRDFSVPVHPELAAHLNHVAAERLKEKGRGNTCPVGTYDISPVVHCWDSQHNMTSQVL